MIIVKIAPEGVEKVFIEAESEEKQDRDLAVWPLVRTNLQRLNRKLEQLAEARVPQRSPTSLG